MLRLNRLSSSFLTLALTFLGCITFAALARLLNANIGYGNGFGCDDWYFFGIHLNFHEIFRNVHAYQLFRFPALVPWIFIGHRIPYEALNAIRFFTYLAITCAGVLWFSTRLFGPKVAAFVTVLLCCSTGFLGVLSNDYVTAAGVVWASLFVGTTVEAGHSKRAGRWGVAAGIAFGLCFYTHMPIVFFLFAVPLLFFAAPGDKPTPSLFALYAAGCVAGFCIITVVCGLYNWSLGGSWFFLGEEIRAALGFLKDASLSVTNRVAGFGWMTREATVVSMDLGVLASVAVLFVGGRGPNARTTSVVASVYLLTAAITMGYEASGRVLLQNNVYAPWIYPTLLASFGAALSRLKAVQDMSHTALAGLLLAVSSVLLIAARTDVTGVSADLFLWLKVAFGAAFVISLVALHRRSVGIVAALALAGFVAVSYPTFGGYGYFPWAASGAQGRDMALQAAQALQKLDELHLTEIPAFWVNASQPETIAIPRGFLRCGDFAGNFPSMRPGRSGWESYFERVTKKMIGSARTIVVIAPGENLASIAASRLRRIGFESSPLGEWHIGSGHVQNTMALLQLTAGKELPETSDTTAVFVGADTTTQGNWVGRYGTLGYAVVDDASSYPSYAQVAVDRATAFTWQKATSDSRALQRTVGAGRVAAAWYSTNRFTIDVKLTDGAPHQVSLYSVDWDTMLRDQRIDVVDTETGDVLDTRPLSGFHQGQYLQWVVRGAVSFELTRVGFNSAVVSGVFIDPSGR